MAAYYITILATFFFSFTALKSEQLGLPKKGRYNPLTKTLLVCTTCVLIFTAGLRYYVGTDFGAYYKGLVIYGGRLKESVANLDEPGLPIFATIVGRFTNDGAYLIFLCSAVCISLLLYSIFSNSDCFVFCAMLFIFTGLWHGTFNGVRQYLAASVILAGHRLILDKKLWKYLAFVFIAFCFHRSSVIMLVPFFIFRNRITFRNVLLLLVGTYIVSANYDVIFSFVGFLKDSDMVMEDNAYYSTTVNIFRVLIFCAPAVTVAVLYWKKSMDSEQSFYFNSLLANAAAMLATSNSAYLARLSIYTNVFTPLALAKLIRFRSKNIETFIKILIVALYAVFWYLEVSGSEALAEFEWVWER